MGTRRVHLVVILAFLGFLLPACGTDKREESADTTHLVMRWVFSKRLATRTALGHVAEVIDRRSDGRIALHFALSNADQTIPEQARESGIPMDMFGLPALSDVYPAISVFEAPYVFRDEDGFYAAVAGNSGQRLLREAAAANAAVILDVWSEGMRHVMLRDRPATTPEEFAHVVLRIPDSRQFRDAVEVLGANHRVLPLQAVFQAIRSGDVDGQENPIPTAGAMGLDAVCGHLILTGHMVTTTAPVVAAESWNRLPPEDRALVVSAFREGGRYNRELVRAREDSLLAAFEHRGMSIWTPDTGPFRLRAARLWEQRESIWPDSLLSSLRHAGGAGSVGRQL